MWLTAAGAIVLIAATIDLGWTTLGTHGGGPISSFVTKAIWKVLLALHRRRPFHKVLSFGGSFILLALISFWVVLIWLGWLLIFSGDPSSIVSTSTHQRVDWLERLYFIGTTMFTSGTTQFVPSGHEWEIVTAVLNGTGLFVATLAITYLLAVLGAIVQKRSMASYMWDMGATPRRIIERAWNETKFDDLSNHLTRLGELLEIFAEQHLAYPILQYYHSENRRTASPLRIAALHDTLLLMAEGAAIHVRPPKLLMATSLDAIRGFAEVVAREFVRDPDAPPPPPDLGILRSLGIPTVDDAAFQAAVAKSEEVRKRLLGIIIDTGWQWEDAFEMNLIP